jgi:hypothetical protein
MEMFKMYASNLTHLQRGCSTRVEESAIHLADYEKQEVVLITSTSCSSNESKGAVIILYFVYR